MHSSCIRNDKKKLLKQVERQTFTCHVFPLRNTRSRAGHSARFDVMKLTSDALCVERLLSEC